MNAISKLLDAAPSTILKWIRNFSDKHAHPSESKTDTVVLELDEMWHYLKEKTNSGYGRQFVVIPENSSHEGPCGGRDKVTLKKLLQRLKNWNIKVYYTDNWGTL